MKYGIRPHFLISLHCLKNFKITECAYRLHQNKTTERRQIQLVLSYQKYWSNSIFHFIFLQKVSFMEKYKNKVERKLKTFGNIWFFRKSRIYLSLWKSFRFKKHHFLLSKCHFNECSQFQRQQAAWLVLTSQPNVTL